MLCLNRLGGTLKKGPTRYRIIRIGGTAHDQPAHKKPPNEPSPCNPAPVFPGKKHVLSEDDIIGARASIVYENCLRQLAKFLILPVDKCTGLLKTGVMCNHVAPFEINITSKGTATSIEWVSLDNGSRIKMLISSESQCCLCHIVIIIFI